MNKKFLSMLSVIVAIPLLLSGCTSINQGGGTYKFDKEYENPSYVQWNSNVADFLAKEGWTVESTQASTLKTYNIAIPESVYAGAKDTQCSVDYNIDFMPAAKSGLPNNSYYMTYKYLNTTLPGQFTDIKIKDTGVKKVKVTGGDPVDMLYVSYGFTVPGASGLTEGSDIGDSKVPDTITGMGKKLVRVFPNPVENPYAKIEGLDASDKYLTVATLSYNCYIDSLDNSIWDKAVESAELNFDTLPKVTGDPIIPERRNPSEVTP